MSRLRKREEIFPEQLRKMRESLDALIAKVQETVLVHRFKLERWGYKEMVHVLFNIEAELIQIREHLNRGF